MGVSIWYVSTRPIDPERAEAVVSAARAASAGRTWLSCEPVSLRIDEDGRLEGFSKPNFHPHPDDVASAASKGLPDGTARDMLDILCRLSRDHGVDWEICHDHSDGPVGSINAGECDDVVFERVEVFADLAEILGDIDSSGDF